MEVQSADYPSTIFRSYPGEMGIALHYREFHWAQRGSRRLRRLDNDKRRKDRGQKSEDGRQRAKR